MEPCITLTTDFGDAGPFVGVMKAVLRARAPTAPLHDLTHHIAPCEPAEAGFWLARCYRYFAPGSVHLAVVDPGVGTARALLAADWDGHRFLAPDNGILPMIVGGGVHLHALDPAWLARQGWPAPSHTFHGRDLFAPLAAALYTGSATVADIGPPAVPQAAAVAPPIVGPGTVSGTVVAIDRWGNLITNIDAGLLPKGAGARAVIAGRELALGATYGDAPPGGLLALVNSFDVVEIACREGNAAATLQVGRGEPVRVQH